VEYESEDIDLVQSRAEPIGATVDAIRDALSWLGKCNRAQAGHSMHLVFKFAPEIAPQTTLKLKVEVNTREHASLHALESYPFAVDNDWYQAKAEIVSFTPDEMFGTKLRALLQRRKNRDMFDLHYGLEHLAIDDDKLVACFYHYLKFEGQQITRAMAEQRMLQKLTASLIEDIAPLLPTGVRYGESDAVEAFNAIWARLIMRLKGEPWKSSGEAIAELRMKRFPGLLLNR
jgi:predicted nucleotidyltransferase component of viral defense system